MEEDTITQVEPRWWSPDMYAEGYNSTSMAMNRLGLSTPSQVSPAHYARLMRAAFAYYAAQRFSDSQADVFSGILGSRGEVQFNRPIAGVTDRLRFITTTSLDDVTLDAESYEEPDFRPVVPRSKKVIAQYEVTFRDGELEKRQRRVSIDPRLLDCDDD